MAIAAVATALDLGVKRLDALIAEYGADTLRAAVREDEVRVCIHDTGPGIPEDILSNIFDPFFTTKFTGRGLVLAAVLGIVRGHSGAIKVYSEPGKGTTFTVILRVNLKNRNLIGWIIFMGSFRY